MVEETAVGVPLMAPLVVENERPEGRDGEMDQDAIGPPLAVGVTVDMDTPFASVSELGL